MKELKIVIGIAILLLAGCAKKQEDAPVELVESPSAFLIPTPEKSPHAWGPLTAIAARNYGVDQKLLDAIIVIESGGNPAAVSKSNAIGLMQIKASTAGREVYRIRGLPGQPSRRDLHDPEKNIDIGTAYLKIIREQHLSGIRDPETLRYAMIVAYVNGSGALLRTFSSDRNKAIDMINEMTPEEFYQHVQNKHPASQAPRYLWKVQTAYRGGTF
ncbi:MAG: Endo-type membrane-bound lytic murein transglycosylase A [Candidatus Erwinia impunctatus]